MIQGDSTTMKTFKVVIVGPPAVGKTSWVSALTGKPYQDDYVPTFGVNVVPLYLKTATETICFNLWDCAGDTQFAGLGKFYIFYQKYKKLIK